MPIFQPFTYILSDWWPGETKLREEIPEDVDEDGPDENKNNKQSFQPRHGQYLKECKAMFN